MDASVADVTSNDSLLNVRGDIDPARRDVALLINARVHVQPDVLRTVVEDTLAAKAGNRLEATITIVRSFNPGRPQPTYRYEAVV